METVTDEGAVSEADRGAIHAAATDYVAAWLDSDPDRMARCLHTSLVKRAVQTDGTLDEMGRAAMVTATTARERRGTYEVTVLDAYDDIAVAKVVSPQYVDYVHLVRSDDRWLLLNVLWQPRVGGEPDPPPPRPPAGAHRSSRR